MKQIANVIKYEGDNSTFVWKHPCEDFNNTTQLIVHETQQALFFMNGQALDLFEAGRYTLETQNIPLINKHFNRAYGSETPFHCEVYFINKTEQMAIKWGTDSRIEYIEPTYGFPIQIGASGEMTVRVEDARRLLIKIVGAEGNLTQAGFIQKIRAFLMLKCKTYFANYIKENSINIFEIDQKLNEMSDAMQEILTPNFSEYGLSLIHFFVTTIVKPEEDGAYRKFKELHFRQYADVAEAKLRQNVSIIDQETEAQRMIIQSQGVAQKRQIEGYTYAQERGLDVAEKAASNEGAGNMANLGIGLGVMAGVAPVIGGAVTSAVEGAVNNQTMSGQPVGNTMKIKCSECGKELPPDARFCNGCGVKLSAKCSKCGTYVTEDAKFCLQCGAKVGGEGNE